VTKYLLPALCAGLAIGRFFVPTHGLSPAGSYEAVAHLVVGGLAGAWLVSKRWDYLGLLVGLTAVELVAFFHK
jgi:hypothetical protein